MEYELCALFGSNHTQEEIDNLAKTVEETLSQSQSEVKFKHSLGRKKLAYEINGQTHGTYNIWFFELDPSKIQELNEKLRLSQNIIRHIIVKLENISIEEKVKLMQETEKTPEKEEPSTFSKNSAQDKISEKAVEETKEKEVQEPKETSENKEQTKDHAKSEATNQEPEKISLDQLDEKLDELLESDKI